MKPYACCVMQDSSHYHESVGFKEAVSHGLNLVDSE